MYSGNMGIAHDLQTILKGNSLVTSPKVYFVFVGGGKRRGEVEGWVAENQDLATILPYQPIETLSHSLSAGDIHLVSMREEYKGLLIPSKIFGILEIGRPVIYVGPEDSEIAHIIRRGQCGFVVANGDVEAYSQYVERLVSSETMRVEMGENALSFAQREFSASKLRKKLAEVVENVCERK